MHLPNGSQIFVEKTRDSEISASKITAVANPVLTLTASHGLKQGDYILVTESNWPKLVNKVARVKNVSADDVTVEGFGTSDTNVFPGDGKGKVVKINDWIELPCVQDLSQEGGEQQFYTFQCLADDREQQIPTYKSAVTLTYTFAHEYDNPIYPVLRKADNSGDVQVMRMYVPKAKEMRIWSGTISFNDIPQTSVNEMETVSISVALKGNFASVAA